MVVKKAASLVVVDENKGTHNIMTGLKKLYRETTIMKNLWTENETTKETSTRQATNRSVEGARE